MDARSLAGELQALLGMVLGINDEVAETVGQRHEVAFGVDDGLLQRRGALSRVRRRPRDRSKRGEGRSRTPGARQRADRIAHYFLLRRMSSAMAPLRHTYRPE